MNKEAGERFTQAIAEHHRSVERIYGKPSVVFFDHCEAPNGYMSLDKETLGGKGWGLWQMTQLLKEHPLEGVAVPPGFILPPSWTISVEEHGLEANPDVLYGLDGLERRTGKKLGDPKNPLLVACRSGAKLSIPGGMDTIVNLGLNNKTVETYMDRVGEERALRAYFDLVVNFGIKVFGIDSGKFADLSKQSDYIKAGKLPSFYYPYLLSQAQEIIRTSKSEEQLTSFYRNPFMWLLFAGLALNDDARRVIPAMQNIRRMLYTDPKAASEFPQDPTNQIFMAIEAVYRSWNNPSAKAYRLEKGIPDLLGTAVVVMEMAETDMAGVMLTSNPFTNEHVPIVSYVEGAPGSEIVGEKKHKSVPLDYLPNTKVAEKLDRIAQLLEDYFGGPQDTEWSYDLKTNTLLLLQTTMLGLQAPALLRHLMEKRLPQEELSRQMTVQELRSLLTPPLDPIALDEAIKQGHILGSGQIVSLGHATGPVVLSLNQATNTKNLAVVVASKVGLDDFTQLPHNVSAYVGRTAGLGSHAARRVEQMARQIPVIFGANINRVQKGDIVTVDCDGALKGRIFQGEIPESAIPTQLTTQEQQLAKSAYQERLNHPWRIVREESKFAELVDVAKSALEFARSKTESHKAHETIVAKRLFPPDILMKFAVVTNPYDIESAINLLLTSIKSGDGTIRTCHHPHRPRVGPWACVSSEEDINYLFDTEREPPYSKYGNYQEMIDGATEVLVGTIPYGTLDQDLFPFHAAWTIGISQAGIVTLQLHPGNPHLRALEEAEPDDLITLSFDPVLLKRSGVNIEDLQAFTIGANLETDNQAHALFNLTRHTIMHEWGIANLLQRMAAIAEVFPRNEGFGIPVCEGQSMRRWDGDFYHPAKTWCKIYGIKVDLMNE